MVHIFIQKIHTSVSLLQSAYTLSVQLKKTFGVSVICSSPTDLQEQETAISEQLKILSIHTDYLSVQAFQLNDLTHFCDEQDVSFLFLQLADNKKHSIRKLLKYTRNLRIPYLFFKDNFPVLQVEKLLVPINFLPEEREKAQFTAAFGRFCQSQITLLQAKDYGSRAAANTSKIAEFLDRFELNYRIAIAAKDSFKLDKAAYQYARQNQYDLLIVSASREYGLDDIVFGPKELQLIHKSKIPILLINPREDLYVLCD